MLEENEELALTLAKDSLEGSELDIVSSNVALRFLCRAKLLTGGYTEEQAVEFLSLTVNKKERAQRQAAKLFQKYGAYRKE